MANHTLSIDFLVRKVKNDVKRACIFARITINGEEKEISLKEFISPDKWDPSSETVNGKLPEIKDLNTHIDNVRNKLKNIYRTLCDTQEFVSAQEVKEAYTGKTHKEHTLLRLIDAYYKKFEKHLAPGTLKNFKATRQYTANFIGHKFKSPDLHVRQLSFAFISEFEAYIPDHPLKAHDPCKGNGVAHHLERLKTMVTWGVDMGWMKRMPFGRFHAHRTKTKRPKLKPHHIHLMETKWLNNRDLFLTRDMFLFGCYTGFSFAEVTRLSMNDFEISAAGHFWCSLYRQKTDELEAIPLLSPAVEIIKKYKDQPASIARGTIFPPITNQQVNRDLKILQEIYEIPFQLTFHIARHTFGYLAVKFGIDIKIVKALMGHAKITTTDIYTEVDEEMAEEAIQKAELATQKRKSLPSPRQFLNAGGSSKNDNLPVGSISS